MALVTVTFLGTGNFVAPAGRYWNAFVARAETTVLVEPSPSALPQLRRAGYSVDQLDAVFVSHFHPDHSFGWPFLLFEMIQSGRRSTLHVVGPPGVASYLEQMMRLGSLQGTHRLAHEQFEIRYVEAEPSSSQSAGDLAFRAVRVDHVPALECFGYVLEMGGLRLGYSGDTHPCEGLDELAGSSDVLVVECNGVHEHESHMNVDSVLALRKRFPEPSMVTTHMGGAVEEDMLPGFVVPNDLDTLTFGG